MDTILSKEKIVKSNEIIDKLNLSRVGKVFYGIGLLGIGIEHFIFQDFIVGRAPGWPETLPGKLVWAYLSGVAFIVISLAILTGKKTRVATVAGALLVFLWAFLRHIPVVASDTFLSGAWTSAGKALVFIGGALAIAAVSPKVHGSGRMFLIKLINLNREFMALARFFLGLFLVLTGIQHFIYTEFVASLIPEWFPGNAIFWTYFAGVALVAGGMGIFIPKVGPLAALLSGLMIFSWVWIVHLPIALTNISNNIAIFEALAFSGIAFTLAEPNKTVRGGS